MGYGKFADETSCCNAEARHDEWGSLLNAIGPERKD